MIKITFFCFFEPFHKPKGVKFETQLEVRRYNCLEVFREYVVEFCDDKSRQKIDLTPAQNSGLKKLKKRVADGEIIVCLTDKSGRLALLPLENVKKINLTFTGQLLKVSMTERRMLFLLHKIGSLAKRRKARKVRIPKLDRKTGK